MAAESVEAVTVGNHATRWLLGLFGLALGVLALAVFAGLVAGAAWSLFQWAWEVFA